VLSTGAIVCEKLPVLRLFRIDFLTLPDLVSGGGVGDGEGAVVAGCPGVDAWFTGPLLG